METAACLVEANEPVYPLDIVRVMRDQRAMAIQTVGQYTFVCESILRAYNDGIIKPLAEYQKRAKLFAGLNASSFFAVHIEVVLFTVYTIKKTNKIDGQRLEKAMKNRPGLNPEQNAL
ncbi:unnamed protein product [Strongylus vulgaris]|uniref:Tyrosine-protein phosphatase domain-containing protein n=1 Tax=Strongylus vulgaris TaxID=40348 RepID=A0A3P7I1D4_STRVU|nr:unnamed protein product [Strongylus vulgaris]